MSDGQEPPDTVEGRSDPSQRVGTRLDDDVSLLAAYPEAWTDAPAQTPVDDDARLAAPESGPPPVTGAVISEAEAGEFQPMLDLDFPDTPHEVPTSGETLPIPSVPIDIHADAGLPDDALQAADIEPNPPGASAAAPEADAQHWPQSDTRGAAPAADIRTEISPIFSALDAAERAAEQEGSISEPDPFDNDFVLPRAHLIDRIEASVAPAASLSSFEPPPIDLPDADTNSESGLEIESATSPGVPPPTDAADAHSDETQTPPPEVLQEDAAARIAAEANATAAALENLRRLLAHKLPEPDIARVPHPLDVDSVGPEHTSPPPIPAYRSSIQLPVAPPPMVAAPFAEPAAAFEAYEDAPPRRRWVAVGSFFAGFALSWVFGAVLYVFLTAG